MTEPHDGANYRPVGTWSGRLIFDAENRLENGGVLLEVHNAPEEHASLVDTQVPLGWNLEDNESLQKYVDFLTVDITFGDEAKKSSEEAGRIHPTRLDGLTAVGPLESLAGARPENDLYVVLVEKSVTVVDDSKLLITQPPIQARGKMRCLARFQGKCEDGEDGLYTIQHLCGGATETIRVPSFPKNNRGLYCSTANEIENSPCNAHGWYLYGQVMEDGIFTVEAWEPRQALLLHALQEAIGGVEADKDALKNRVWKGARYKKGTVETILLDPTSETEELDKREAIENWKEGERFLVIHLFGGIGGKVVNEENMAGIIPGHFAFGDATIVRDDFTGELQFRIIHRQVYAHNNGGIISGPNLWPSYCGDLQRGWFGTRPISDIIIKFDPISKVYSFEGSEIPDICPLDEMIRELNEMSARYRTGDGDGSALVSSAHSCVQDSNQALFAALNETERKLHENPDVNAWLEENPEHPYNSSIAQIDSLFDNLDKYLTPFGVRKDWSETAKGLRGTGTNQTLFGSLFETFKTWRTVVPRRAHDTLAEIFLDHGAQLWFVRTNQVGGHDPDIVPLAPACAFDYHDNEKIPKYESHDQ